MDGDLPVRRVIFIENRRKGAFESITSGHAHWHIGCFMLASGSQLAINERLEIILTRQLFRSGRDVEKAI